MVPDVPAVSIVVVIANASDVVVKVAEPPDVEPPPGAKPPDWPINPETVTSWS